MTPRMPQHTGLSNQLRLRYHPQLRMSLAWWLRTPSRYLDRLAGKNVADTVNENGKISYGRYVCEDGVGVRPALWIKVLSDIF